MDIRLHVPRAGFETLVRWMLGFAIALVGAGCGSEPEQSASDVPLVEKQRRAASEEAVNYLIDAQGAYRQGQYRRALALTDSVLALEDTLADAFALRGHVFTELRQLDRARSAYQTALDQAPGYEGAWFNLGNLAFREGDFRDAVDLYGRAAETHPTARAYENLGRSYEQLDQVDSARAAYEEAIGRDSTFASAYVRLGQLLEDEGRLQEALSYSERGLAYDSTDANYRYIVGSQRYQAGRIEEAIPLLRSVVQSRPGHHGAHYNLGQALLRAGREEEARRYLQKADSLEKVQAEIDQLRTTAESNPKNLKSWLDYANALRESGQFSEALEAYEVALSIAPSSLVVRGNIADMHQRLGNVKEAVTGYRSVLEQDSTSISAWFNLGVLYANAGRYDQARRAWKTVLEYDPDHARARTYLRRLNQRSSS